MAATKNEYQAAESAITAIIQERKRQDEKWGVQNHSSEWWLAILMEEVGELAQAILETHFDNGPEVAHLRGVDNIRNEAIQCAAVAMAMIECIERNAIYANVARHWPSPGGDGEGVERRR